MAIRTVVTRGFGNGTFNATIAETVLAGYSTNPILAVGGTYNAHAFFPTGSTVNITLYDPLTGDTVATTSSLCNEYGATGLFVWDISNITTLPTPYKEYGYIMTDGLTSQGGTITYDEFLIQYIIHEEMLN